jgi:hypothetical protein
MTKYLNIVLVGIFLSLTFFCLNNFKTKSNESFEYVRSVALYKGMPVVCFVGVRIWTETPLIIRDKEVCAKLDGVFIINDWKSWEDNIFSKIDLGGDDISKIIKTSKGDLNNGNIYFIDGELYGLGRYEPIFVRILDGPTSKQDIANLICAKVIEGIKNPITTSQMKSTEPNNYDDSQK